VTRRAREGCALGRALRTPEAVTVSPDDRNVYVASTASRHTSARSAGDAVAVFGRDAMTGALRQLPGRAGCVNSDGSRRCARGRALLAPAAVALSPEGANAYVASAFSDAVAVFARDPVNGALRQLVGRAGCVNADGSEGCARGRALSEPVSVAVSPDARSVYVASFASDGAATFGRDSMTGALRQLAGRAGCVNLGGSQGCTRGRALFPPAER
jgi:DNA-binding beta-propeller fold protein YncE